MDDAGWFTIVKFPRIFVYSESTARIVSALPETMTLPRYCPGYVSTISSPSAAASTAVCMLSPDPTVMTAPRARVVPRIRLRKKVMMEYFMIKNNYFTVAPVDSMVTVPPVGTAIGAMSKPSTIGLSVVRPLGINCAPKHSNVTGTIPVIVLWIGWPGVDAGRVGGEGEVAVEFWVGIEATFHYTSCT